MVVTVDEDFSSDKEMEIVLTWDTRARSWRCCTGGAGGGAAAHLAAAACKSIVWSIVPWLRSWHFICDMKQGDVQFRACVTSWAPIFGQQPSAARHMKLAMRVPAAGGARTFAVDVLFAQSLTKLKIISRRATTNCSICFQNRIGCSSLCRHPPVKKVWAFS